MLVRNEQTGESEMMERLERVENCLAMLLGADIRRPSPGSAEERLVRVERQMAAAVGIIAADDYADTDPDAGDEPVRRFSLDRDCVETDPRSLARSIAAELAAIERRYACSWPGV